jgi:hypothetical protein
MARRDPHEVLGVPRSAPVREIRRAYRERARELHPDASGTDATAEAFHQATLAYQELCAGANDPDAVPVPVTVVSPRADAARPLEAEELVHRRTPDAEPLVAERWRRTESQDLASDLAVEEDLELLLRLLRAGYFPW